jgi:hypothetical protein
MPAASRFSCKVSSRLAVADCARQRREGRREDANDSRRLVVWCSWFGAGALAIGVVCSVGIAISGNIRDAQLKRDLAASAERIANAGLKAEQLRKELGPRRLQREIFLKKIAEARVEIMYLRDDPECFDLAQQVWRALEDAKWDVTPPIPIPVSAASLRPTAMAVDAQPSGVTVVVHGITEAEANTDSLRWRGQAWVRTLWTVLMHALGDAIGKNSRSRWRSQCAARWHP